MANNFHFDLRSNDNDEVPKYVTSVTIHPSVTTIRRAAFKQYLNLQSLHLPDTITIIENFAFSDCSQLQSINLPDTITHIGGGSFEGCSKLQSLHLPDSIITIEYQAFQGCFKLQSINLPHTITYIDHHTFTDCSQLQLIALNESIEVDADAFHRCSALEARLVNGKNYNADTITWLRQRFNDLPLHQLFYEYRTTESAMTTAALRTEIEQYSPEVLITTDAMGMTPLHILCANQSAIPFEWLKILRAAQPDAASMRTVLGHTPLMMLLYSKDIHQYHELPLVWLLEGGLRYDAMETILVSHKMQLADEMQVEDEESGLLPFMYAASLVECNLDVVYHLAIHHPHLLCKNFKDDDVSYVAKRHRLE